MCSLSFYEKRKFFFVTLFECKCYMFLVISASQMQSANSAEDVEHSPVSSGHASSSNSQKSPAGVQGDPGPHSFSTPYGDKPPDMSEHSDSGFRSEDGNGEGQNRFTPDMKQVEGRVESLQV